MAAIPADQLKESVFHAVKCAAVELCPGDAVVVGYDERTGTFEVEVTRKDKQKHTVTVRLVMETFLGR